LRHLIDMGRAMATIVAIGRSSGATGGVVRVLQA